MACHPCPPGHHCPYLNSTDCCKINMNFIFWIFFDLLFLPKMLISIYFQVFYLHFALSFFIMTEKIKLSFHSCSTSAVILLWCISFLPVSYGASVAKGLSPNPNNWIWNWFKSVIPKLGNIAQRFGDPKGRCSDPRGW